MLWTHTTNPFVLGSRGFHAGGKTLFRRFPFSCAITRLIAAQGQIAALKEASMTDVSLPCRPGQIRCAKESRAVRVCVPGTSLPFTAK